MARFTRIEVATKMKQQGLVPLFFHRDLDLGKKVLEAVYRGGGRFIEFTNRGDYAHQIFGELNKFAERELPELIMGAGTIPDAGTASLYMQLGANFIVTPMLKEDVATVCNRRKVLWAPGCATLSEVSRAEELGAEIVKAFPGSQLGPGFIKAVTAPCPWTDIMPTGGVKATRENLSAWFNSGAACVGMGSDLITKEHLANRDFEGLEEHVRNTVQLVEDIRN